MKKITVVVDTREKTPWNFNDNEIVGKTIRAKLDTGDYSIEGLEDLLCIERKKSVSEFAHNVVEKRFTNEVIRMMEYPYRFLLLEFDIDDVLHYPHGSDIPQRKWKTVKVTDKLMMSCIAGLQINNGIHVLFCGNDTGAQLIATNIMKKVATSRNLL